MLGRKIAEGLELPEEALTCTPLMTVCGKGSVVVENFKRITCFSPEAVVLITKGGSLCIRGRELRLEYIRTDIVKIIGEICEIQLK